MNEIVRERLNKLESIRVSGVDAYERRFERTYE